MTGQRGRRLILLIIGLAVIAFGIDALVGGSGFIPIDGHTLERTFNAGSARHVVVEALNGPITYETWDGHDIRIEATKRQLAPTSGIARLLGGDLDVEFAQSGGQVEAKVRRRGVWFLFGNPSVHFRVQVPHSWQGTTALTTRNGAINARDLSGNATLRTSNGAIVVDGHTGALEARTSNGRMELMGLNGSLHARTSNGAIRILNSTLTEAGRVRTSNGSITMEARLASNSVYDVRTSNGSVSLVLIDPDVTVDLRSSRGRINLQTDINVSSIDRNRVSGRIGTGTATLNVNTSNGSVSLNERR